MEHILGISDRLARILTVFALTMLMSACAELNSIYRSQPLPNKGPHLVSIDSKQRVVLSNSVKAVAKNNPNIVRFCAEPSPDVFTAIASSLSAEASLSQSASKEVAAKLTSTISENAATIERTQTINILREVMYRNCERYLSGGISEDEFIIQAARDQQLIVQVLAVEQITGVAKTQSTALTTVARAAASGVSDTSLATLTSAKKEVDAKRAASTKVIAEATTLTPEGQCSSSPVDETSPPNGVTADQAKSKNAKCEEVAKASQLLKDAEEYYTLVRETVAKQGSVSSETMGMLATAASNASAANIEIAEKVVEIARQNQAFDEIGMTCVVKLRTQKDPPEYCKSLLRQIVATRSAQLKFEEDRLNAERVKMFRADMHTDTQSAAETVWNKLGRNITSKNLKVLVDKAGVSLPPFRIKQLLAAKTNFAAFVKTFKKLPGDQQEQLATAALQP